jgi:hypothetical protein
MIGSHAGEAMAAGDRLSTPFTAWAQRVWPRTSISIEERIHVRH